MRLLSYPLGPDTPPYGGQTTVVFEPLSLIERGDACNTHQICTRNHMGTHVDAPWHFNPLGPRVSDLGPEWFLYDRAVLIDVPKSDDEVITAEDLMPHVGRLADSDLVMVRTGWGARLRTAEPERYGSRNPGFHPSAATVLMRAPKLRALAMDLPSATAPAHADLGAEFHRAVLGRNRGDRFLLVVEDVRLDDDLEERELGHGLVVAPLLLANLDGAPATVIVR